MRDEELLCDLRHGTPEAMEQVIRQYGAYVSAVIGRQLGRRAKEEDVEELASDTFVALWKSCRRIRNSELRPWLAAVARNKAFSFLRKQRETVMDEEAYLAVPDEKAEKELEDRETSLLVYEVLEGMEEIDRLLLCGFYLKEETVDELAEQYAMRPSTVRSRLSRGRGKFKKALKERGIELEDDR